MAESAEKIVALVEKAFQKVRLGSGVSIRQARVIDMTGYEDGRGQRKARANDEKGDWRLIPDSLIAEHQEALCFMDAEGLRYNLPAYMRYALRNYHVDRSNSSIYATFYQLSRTDSTKFSLFSEAQRAAVVEFLRFFANEGTDYREEAERTLEVWKDLNSIA